MSRCAVTSTPYCFFVARVSYLILAYGAESGLAAGQGSKKVRLKVEN